MYFTSWMKRWLTIVCSCVFVMIGCGTYLLINEVTNKKETSSPYAMNQVRLKVSNLMYYLEQNFAAISLNEHVRRELHEMCEETGVELTVIQLDGRIQFSSSNDTALQKLNVKHAVHYDVYRSIVENNRMQIAFPLVDDQTGSQVGNAIFSVPTASIFVEKSNAGTMIAYTILVVTALILFGLLSRLKSNMNNGLLLPISKLKDHSAAILKGNFEQKLEYTKMDEIGEVYSMFDQMRIEMKHLNEKREEQDRAQKELISSISHDLKTPLTTVKAYIEAILDGVCSNQEAVHAYIEVMNVNTDKMTRLVDDLLLHSLRELGQVSVHPTEQYSKTVFSQILKPLRHVVQTMGVTFIGPKEIPNVLVNIDVNRLEQVIANLVANALKHTSTGDTISIQIIQEEKVLRVTIADTGEGILQEDMPFIFERYFKGQTSFIHTKHKNEGNGLGLSICKYIIEAHNGTISFSSKKGQGTTFYFTLPLS